MEVYFVDINEYGKNIIHRFGCPLSKASDREFLGLFINLSDALNGIHQKYYHGKTCSYCCLDYCHPN